MHQYRENLRHHPIRMKERRIQKMALKYKRWEKEIYDDRVKIVLLRLDNLSGKILLLTQEK